MRTGGGGGGRGGGGGFDLINVSCLHYVFGGKADLRKQCRPRSDAAEGGV